MLTEWTYPSNLGIEKTLCYQSVQLLLAHVTVWSVYSKTRSAVVYDVMAGMGCNNGGASSDTRKRTA